MLKNIRHKNEEKMVPSHQVSTGRMNLYNESINMIMTNGDTTALKLVEMKKGGSL